MEMKVERLATQTIKPSSPTPEHHRFVKLSLLDQLTPSFRAAVVLFYPVAAIDIRQVLKSSLSEILTKFYPYARRIKGNSSIKCTAMVLSTRKPLLIVSSLLYSKNVIPTCWINSCLSNHRN